MAVLTQWAEDQLRSFPTTAQEDGQLLSGWAASSAAAEAAAPRGAAGVDGSAMPEECEGIVGVSVPGQTPNVATLRGPDDAAAVWAADGDALMPELKPRLRLAVEYRLERKLLLLAALELLRRLQVQIGADPTIATGTLAVGGASDEL